jgi:hypothetical protein
MVDTARNFFLGKNGYPRKNCAEAVKFAAQERHGIEHNGDLSACGSGRAPDGLCGACYAVYSIINSENRIKAAEFLDHFNSKAGSIKCREIRSARITSCIRCVEIAAEYSEQLLEKTRS